MIESTCCYIRREHSYLMLLRNKKKNDVNKGKWIGIGGKRENNESFLDCAKREILEETGLIAQDLKEVGILYFYANGSENEKIVLYTCDSFMGETIDCNEGTLKWIDEKEILSLSLWDGDRIFLEDILKNDDTKFCYEFHYDQNGNLKKYIKKEAETI